MGLLQRGSSEGGLPGAAPQEPGAATVAGVVGPSWGSRGTGATLPAREHPGPWTALLGSPRSLPGRWGRAHGARTAAGLGPGMSSATDCLCHGAPNQVWGVRQPCWEADSCNALLHPVWGAAGGESTPQ